MLDGGIIILINKYGRMETLRNWQQLKQPITSDQAPLLVKFLKFYFHF